MKRIGEEQDMEKKPEIHMIGNTHYDPVWLWTWDEGMSSIRSTFLAALDRMEEDPGFIYSFSCPPVFEWIREVDPELFDRIKSAVQEGRWELVEGWWLQPDCSAASGESYVRQGLYGQQYLQEHFGRQSKTAFNIDSFGHCAMLPQILAKSGISYYVLGRPSPAEKELPGPLFRWESPDGSAVLAYRCADEGAGMYSQDVEKDIMETALHLNKFGHDLMIVYGVTNHGGAPTKKTIAQIRRRIDGIRPTNGVMSLVDLKLSDGNQPTDGTQSAADTQSIECIHQENAVQLPYNVKFSTTEAFFAKQDTLRLPVVQEELLVKFFGVFSNHPEVKKNNRLGEYALLNAEKTALLRKWLQGRNYPREKLTAGWKDLMFNQFHDILGGACIRNAYADARNLHGRVLQTANEIVHFGLQAMTREIHLSNSDYPGVAWNLVVWNLNAFDVMEPVEAEVQWAWEFDWYRGPLRITDTFGNDMPCQVIREYSVIPGFRARVVFHASIPSLGYRTFLVHQELSRDEGAQNLVANDESLENNYFRVEICRETGCIASVFDKRREREVLRNAAKAIVRQDDGDTWGFNITGYGEARECFKMDSAGLIENGPVRTVIRTKGRYGNSHLEQDFILYRDMDVIDGSFKVNWREKHKVLKLTFDTSQTAPVVTASIPYGSVTRKADGCEYPMGEWVDVSSEDFGVSLLSDSVFAYDVETGMAEKQKANAESLNENAGGGRSKGATIGLTLLRSAIFGDLRIEPIDLNLDYDVLGQGISEGKWRMVMHNGNWRSARIPNMSMQFNNPPVVVVEANHSGTRPSEDSFLQVEGNSILLTTAKISEKGDDLIFRMHEYAGAKDTVQVTSRFIGHGFKVHCGRYEIKTLRVDKIGHVKETDMLES